MDDDNDDQEGTNLEVTEYPNYDDNLDFVGSTDKVIDRKSKRLIAIIDFNSDGKGKIRYCPNCETYGAKIRLGAKIKKNGEPPAPDDDQFLSCYEFGNTFPIH